MYRLIIPLLLAALVFTSSAFSKVPEDVGISIVVASEEMKGLTASDGTGLYWDILRAIYESEDLHVLPIILPYARARMATENGMIDAMLSARPTEAQGLFFPHWHYGVNFISVIVKKNDFENWQGEYSLQDKRVGIIRGTNYEGFLYVPVKIYPVTQRSNGLLMLSKGRLDCFLDDRMDLQRELILFEAKLRDGGFKIEEYRIENVVAVKQYVAFTDSPKGRRLADIYDKGINRLLNSGQLKAIFDKHGTKLFPFPMDVEATNE